MKALSLFAGVGGFDLAAERAGIQVVAHCEIDKAARSVLRRRFPNALSFDDVRTLTADDLRRADAVPDLICGGFPCQDLSVAGRRAGLAGARSGLFYDIARLAADLRPRWLVLENVPGLLSSNDGRDMGAVLGTLGELGYGWAYRVLDAQHFGVPQRRRRVFIVGCLGDGAAPVEVLLEPEGSGGDPAAGSQARQELAGTLGGGSGSRGWAPDTDRMTFLPVATTLLARQAKGPDSDGEGNLIPQVWPLALRGREDGAELEIGEEGIYNALRAGDCGSSRQSLIAHTLTGEGFDASEDGTGRGTPLVPHVAPTITASWGQNNGQPGNGGKDEAVIAWGISSDAIDRSGEGDGSPGQRAGLGITENLSPSLRAMHPQAVASQLAVRRLTPMECERLQGFPDGWTEGQADSSRYRQMGNAVAVPVVEWILRRLVAVATSQEQAGAA